MEEYKRCTRCVMDNKADATITFDNDGVCNYCTNAIKDLEQKYFPNEEGEKKLNAMLAKIKKEGEGHKYDCIMGLSGGLDSSYLAYLGYKWGLRVLAVHIDDGYDTEISKSNLEKLVKKTGFTYEVIKPNASQFNALTKAYLKAGVPNVAIPQDNVLFAFIYKKMKEENIHYFLSGSNLSLESILQRGNTHKSTDVVNIKDINKKNGNADISELRFISTTWRMLNERFLHIRTLKPLNLVDYNRERAFAELAEFCDFQYYGRKHLENILTAFIQLYWLPKKFGVDKRTSHLSSMIISGQMTREEALKELAEPLYDEKMMEDYIRIIKRNMSMSDKEFDEIMSAPSHQHTDYKTEDEVALYRFFRRIYKSMA